MQCSQEEIQKGNNGTYKTAKRRKLSIVVKRNIKFQNIKKREKDSY